MRDGGDDGDFILVISACEATEQQLTSHFRKKAGRAAVRPPVYLFTTADAAPTFSDALVSWIVFYHQLPRVSVTLYRLEDIFQAGV